MPTFVGTSGNDILTGTVATDFLEGRDGNDTLRGADGNDDLIGGHGDDILLGEGGDDWVIENDGGSGNDFLDGGAGNDFVSLYRLDRTLNETVTLRGGDGNDHITSWSYASGSVTIDAGTGDDYVQLFSSDNSHHITLGSGRDVLDLSPFQPLWGVSQTVRTVVDFRTGAAGDTVLLYNLLSGYGEWDGQSNPFETGVIRLIQQGSDVVLQMTGLPAITGFVDLLVFRNVDAQSFVAENFGGLSPNGVPAAPINLIGDAGYNRLDGGYGDDIIDGLAGNDNIDGSAGNDVLRGGDGDDVIYGGEGNDIVEGGAGNDSIDFQHDGGSDSIHSGTGDDWIRIYRNWRDVVEHISVDTGDGNDQLSFQNFDQGTLTVAFGSGADRFTLLGTRHDITLTLGADADVVDLSQNYIALDHRGLLSIADYAPGDDRIEWGTYLQNELVGWDGEVNPFAKGYLQLEQQSGQVVLLIDRDGAGFDHTATPFLVLENLTLSSLSPADFAGFLPRRVHDPRNDFNGDGRSDILWRHDDGAVTDWLGRADGRFDANTDDLNIRVGADWHVAGTGDFNGDGLEDVIWRNDDGRLAEWLGHPDGNFTGNPNANFSVAASWHVAGTGDFNGDGFDDILWRNDNGTVTDWLGRADGRFDGNTDDANIQVAASWQVAGVGDFNGDGRDDILWRNDNGRIAEWLGQTDGGFAGNASANYNVATSWHIVGTGDFNGDGRDDILWRNDNGTVTDWLGRTDGRFDGNSDDANIKVGATWDVASIGDFNGDGHDDVLWRNADGRLIEWLGQADGGFAGNPGASSNVAPSWHIQSPDLWM